uniref:SAM-dependent methyltransferase n=1 Tax=Actinomadura sp. CA-154981 TaxID=3240037 RepID=UPI003F490942
MVRGAPRFLRPRRRLPERRRKRRQLLDIRTGLPADDNTHQVAQHTAPASRVVYVDNDPLVLVLVLGRALASSPEGSADCLDGDLRHPEQGLAGARQFLDFIEPIALMLMGVMGHVADDVTAHAIVETLLEELPPGSFLALYDATGAAPYRLRMPEEIAAFFTGFDLIDPGIVPLTHCRPAPSPDIVEACGGVSRTLPPRGGGRTVRSRPRRQGWEDWYFAACVGRRGGCVMLFMRTRPTLVDQRV